MRLRPLLTSLTSVFYSLVGLFACQTFLCAQFSSCQHRFFIKPQCECASVCVCCYFCAWDFNLHARRWDVAKICNCTHSTLMCFYGSTASYAYSSFSKHSLASASAVVCSCCCVNKCAIIKIIHTCLLESSCGYNALVVLCGAVWGRSSAYGFCCLGWHHRLNNTFICICLYVCKFVCVYF